MLAGGDQRRRDYQSGSHTSGLALLTEPRIAPVMAAMIDESHHGATDRLNTDHEKRIHDE
jgi:hypothetical protein